MLLLVVEATGVVVVDIVGGGNGGGGGGGGCEGSGGIGIDFGVDVGAGVGVGDGVGAVVGVGAGAVVAVGAVGAVSAVADDGVVCSYFFCYSRSIHSHNLVRGRDRLKQSEKSKIQHKNGSRGSASCPVPFVDSLLIAVPGWLRLTSCASLLLPAAVAPFFSLQSACMIP